MQKLISLFILVYFFVSLTHCTPVPFKNGSVEKLSLNSEQVKQHKEEQEIALSHAKNKQQVASANKDKSAGFSFDRSYYKALKAEEGKYARTHQKAIKKLDKIPHGGEVQLEKSQSGNRSKYTILKPFTASDKPSTSALATGAN